jgi:hypothetical protein
MRKIDIQDINLQMETENVITALGLLGACALLASVLL